MSVVVNGDRMRRAGYNGMGFHKMVSEVVVGSSVKVQGDPSEEIQASEGGARYEQPSIYSTSGIRPARILVTRRPSVSKTIR